MCTVDLINVYGFSPIHKKATVSVNSFLFNLKVHIKSKMHFFSDKEGFAKGDKINVNCVKSYCNTPYEHPPYKC